MLARFLPAYRPAKLSQLRLFPMETSRFGLVAVIIETQ